MVLCFSICWYPSAFSQLQPKELAEKYFRKKLVENRIRTDFQFDEPLRQGEITIFECAKPEGFVLVRESDSCMVVGYSIGNRFSRNSKIPDPASAFLESLTSCGAADLIPVRQKTVFTPIGPLLNTTWSQEGFFNYYCPEDRSGPDNHVYVGCAAVAMGQIIRYFGKFNNFQIATTTEDYKYGTLTAMVGNYDWNRMENRPIVPDLEVSRFLYGLGVLTRMGYGTSSSTTSNFNVYDAFKQMKYFNANRMVRGTTSAEVWIQNFTQNIADFQPVYVSGSSHSFVCDGIDATGWFHFNLGWYGYADGYYPLKAIMGINPSEAIFNLSPYSNNLPPANLTLDTLNGQKLLKWEKHRLTPVDPTSYRVYLNDTTVFETRETEFNTSFFPPGNHELMVTAVYPDGESHWIGPIRLATQSSPITIPDEKVKKAMHDELLRIGIAAPGEDLTINQLLKIQQLTINKPFYSLAGIENCHNIQVLSIEPDQPVILDPEPISRLKRLKSLNLKNITLNNPGILTQNKWLIYLNLDRCNTLNFNFLTGFPGLQHLKLTDVPLSSTDAFSNLLTLKQLTLSGCSLTNAGFIQNLINLEYIDLSRNQLSRIRLSAKLPELQALDISQNQINELYFLEYIPNIERLNLGTNLINRFVTNLNFKSIQYLNLENNMVDSLWVGSMMPCLTHLFVSNNKIRNIRFLNDFAPGLLRLDAAANQIPEFWKGSLQQLEYLDISHNRLSLLNNLTDNPLLKHVNLSFNQIADLYPIYEHSKNGSIQYLNLAGNPLSKESFEQIAPQIRGGPDTLLLPDYPQEYSPGNPQPFRNQVLTSQKAELSWISSPIPTNGKFEIFSGYSPESLLLNGTVSKSDYSFDILPGRNYYWRVRAVLPDTSFFSGLFRFVTYQSLTLPYKEDFEVYPPYSYLTDHTDYWIKSIGEPTVITDGRIDPSRKSEGKQSLKLFNSSDLRLPMSHLNPINLYISMQLLIAEGCIAAVSVNDINGASLQIYYKSNKKCDILFNNRLITEIIYRNGEWFPLQINLFGKGNEIWLRIGTINIQIPWNFTGGVAHVGEIGLASAPGTIWPTDGQPLFYVDKIEIKSSGSENVDLTPDDLKISIYPNPADEYILIEDHDRGHKPEILLFDFSGRNIGFDLNEAGLGIYKINVSNLVPGIYLVRVNSATGSRVAKICVSR